MLTLQAAWYLFSPQQGCCALPGCETILLRAAHMRTVCCGQVSDHSQDPQSWNEVEVDDAADKPEVENQVLEDGSFPDPPELRLLSDRGALCKWQKLHTLPSGDLTVKVMCHKEGQFDVQLLAICVHFC